MMLINKCRLQYALIPADSLAEYNLMKRLFEYLRKHLPGEVQPSAYPSASMIE